MTSLAGMAAALMSSVGGREAAADRSTPRESRQRARDGSTVRWGGPSMAPLPDVIAPGAPVLVEAAVAPVRPGHSLIVEYRTNGGPVRQAVGVAEPLRHDLNGRVFRTVLPGQAGGLIEYQPVLCFAGQPVSPRLVETAACPWYRVRSDAAPGEPSHPPAAATALAEAAPRWNWNARFLGACTIALQKEGVGDVPDGLRIIWRFAAAHFSGPILFGDYLPGAADWMRIRPDGVAIVQVQGCIQTPGGARVYTSYGGYLELGPDGYARAQREDFDPWPPFVCAATYATADKDLGWLNRAQCLILGRVDMKTLRVESDAYLVEVGGRNPSSTV